MFIQEEISQGIAQAAEKVITLACDTAKMTAQHLQAAIREYLKEMNNPNKIYRGKQTIKQLVESGAALSNIEITDKNIKSFEPVAKKYGLDYALKKDKSKSPPVYYVFFKGKDTDVITMAFDEYSKKQIKRQNKPSIRKALAQLIEKAKSAPSKDRARRHEQEHEL